MVGLGRLSHLGLTGLGVHHVHQLFGQLVQLLRLLPIALHVICRPGVVPVKFRAGNFLVKGLPIGVVQLDLDAELLHRGGHVELGAVQVVVPLPLPALLRGLLSGPVQALHGLPPLEHLLFHVELGDLGGKGIHLGGHLAGVALQGAAGALIQGAAVLRDSDGLDVLALEGPAHAVLYAEQAVLLVHIDGAAPKADVEAIGLLKLLLESLVLLKGGQILLEIGERHVVDGPGGQVHLGVALLADGLPFDLGGQQPGGGVAADGAELLLVTE